MDNFCYDYPERTVEWCGVRHGEEALNPPLPDDCIPKLRAPLEDLSYVLSNAPPRSRPYEPHNGILGGLMLFGSDFYYTFAQIPAGEEQSNGWLALNCDFTQFGHSLLGDCNQLFAAAGMCHACCVVHVQGEGPTNPTEFYVE